MMNTNFLEACRLNKVKRLVYTSSIGAYSSREIFIEDEVAWQTTNGYVSVSEKNGRNANSRLQNNII